MKYLKRLQDLEQKIDEIIKLLKSKTDTQISDKPQFPNCPQSGTNSGEWCTVCGCWKTYGLNDTHHCTGYKVTC